LRDSSSARSAKEQTRVGIIAKLSGCDTATAEGATVTSSSPVLAHCRKLVERGYDPAQPLHACRGDVLALTVRSIGEGARLEVNGQGTGFRPACQPGSGPTIAPTAPTPPKGHDRDPAHRRARSRSAGRRERRRLP
jgi:hypothetical protein